MEEMIRIDLTYGLDNPKIPFKCEPQVSVIRGAAIGELHHRANCYRDNWCRLRDNKYSKLLSFDERVILDTSCGSAPQKHLLNKIYNEHGIIAIKSLYNDGWVYYGRYLKEIIVENLNTMGIDGETLEFIKYLTHYKSMSHSIGGIKETDSDYLELLHYMFNNGIDVEFVMNPLNHQSWLDVGHTPYLRNLKDIVGEYMYGPNNHNQYRRLDGINLNKITSIQKLKVLSDIEPQLFI